LPTRTLVSSEASTVLASSWKSAWNFDPRAGGIGVEK